MRTFEQIENSTESILRRRQLTVERVPTALTVLAVVAGSWLRWARLGSRSLWFDEGYTGWVISHPLGEIIRLIRADTAPPLYYMLLREWTLVFGRSEAGMRSLSALFGTMTLLVFVLIAGRVLNNRWVVAAAVGLFSLSFMQIAYAHEARFYAMMAFLGAVDLYLVLLICERSSVWRLAALVLAWTASLYTNNMMTVYLACLAGAWLLLPGDRPVLRRLRDVLIVGTCAVLAFSPWVPSMLAQMSAIHGHFWATTPTPLDLETTISAMAGIRDQSIGDFLVNRIWLPGVAVVDVAMLIFLLLSVRAPRHVATAGGLAMFGLVPIVFVYGYSHVSQPIYMDRAFLVSSVVMPLLIAVPLDAVARTRWRQWLAAAYLLMMVLAFKSLPTVWLGTQEENWRDAMAFAVQTPAKHRVVVFVANEGELFYDYYIRGGDYSPRSDLIGCPSSFFAIDPPHTMRHVQSEGDLDGLRRVLDGGKFDEVVFVASHNWFADPPFRTLNLLKSRLPLLEQKTISRLTVFRFGTRLRS